MTRARNRRGARRRKAQRDAADPTVYVMYDGRAACGDPGGAAVLAAAESLDEVAADSAARCGEDFIWYEYRGGEGWPRYDLGRDDL